MEEVKKVTNFLPKPAFSSRGESKILRRSTLGARFPTSILKIAEEVVRQPPPDEDAGNRRDLGDMVAYTIDNSIDAADVDDAVFCSRNVSSLIFFSIS